MYFVIEYVDTFTGAEGEPVCWEFAKTEGEARIKAKAHFLLVKVRHGAQGYRILSPEGSPIAYGPGSPEATCVTMRKDDYRLLKQETQKLGRCGSYAGPVVEIHSECTRLYPTEFLHKESTLGAQCVPPRDLFVTVQTSEKHPSVSLSGKRVLVVEDEGLVALDLVSELQRAGRAPVGPAARPETAMIMAAAQKLDAAVLDVLLGDAYVWQVAEALRAQGVPFLFQTAFSRVLDFPPDLASVPRLDKPVRPGVLKRVLTQILQVPP